MQQNEYKSDRSWTLLQQNEYKSDRMNLYVIYYCWKQVADCEDICKWQFTTSLYRYEMGCDFLIQFPIYITFHYRDILTNLLLQRRFHRSCSLSYIMWLRDQVWHGFIIWFICNIIFLKCLLLQHNVSYLSDVDRIRNK